MARPSRSDQARRMTATLHIENTVREFDAWKQVFDRFERFRTEGEVRHLRVSRRSDNPSLVSIDLDFDSAAQALAFLERLQKVWASPQSQEQLTDHAAAVLQELVESRTL
jgi:hypothetical protein